MAETATGTYPRAAETVFAVLVDGLSETRLKVKRADPEQGIVWATTRVTLWSWGENVTIYVDPREPEATDVRVESYFRFQRFAFRRVHQQNFAEVFGMLDRRLDTLHLTPPGLWSTGA